ncbi:MULTISPECIES: cyclic nucleotide-binding domain-containing protein [Aphanothece]|uniref:cyclic nucleotide-binding domain-containing protein n=1 Tax=Aphanothece TaxID=1121 RepID=UPI003984940A
MVIFHTILLAFLLELVLLAVLFICRKRRLPPIPVRLPTLAIISWLVITILRQQSFPPDVLPWLDTVQLITASYAYLQLSVWLTLEFPTILSWWPRPPKILRDLGLLVIAGVITVVVLQEQARINVVGLVTTSAILTAVIGLAAQESLKDFFAGIVLQLDSPFQEGDFIVVSDEIEGWVVSLTLMSTRLRHVHGALITMPNSRMWSTEIRRFGPSGPIAREIHLNLDLTLPPERATELLMQVARRHPLVLAEPEPTAFVYAYADHAITYELEVWQEDPTDNGFDILRGQLLAQIWYVLEREGTTLPYPVRELRPKRLPAPIDDPAGYGLEARVDLLRENVLFGHLSSEQLERIAPLTRCLRFAAGEAVVVEGDEGFAMFQVVTGRVQVIKLMEGGIEKKVAELGVGTIFGEMSVFTDQPRTATVRTTEESVLLEVERNDLRPLLEGNPRLVERLAQLVNDRRAQLTTLSQEVQEAQANQLLQQMMAMFSTLTGGDSRENLVKRV